MFTFALNKDVFHCLHCCLRFSWFMVLVTPFDSLVNHFLLVLCISYNGIFLVILISYRCLPLFLFNCVFYSVSFCFRYFLNLFNIFLYKVFLVLQFVCSHLVTAYISFPSFTSYLFVLLTPKYHVDNSWLMECPPLFCQVVF